MLASDFRTFLLAQSAISALVGTAVHVDHVPQEIALPYLWVSRARTAHERTLDQAQGEQPFEEAWDIEAISDSLSEAQDLAAAVRGVDCAKGTFGDGTIQLLVIEDQSDDYIPRGTFGDDGLSVCAFAATVYGYEAAAASSV